MSGALAVIVGGAASASGLRVVDYTTAQVNAAGITLATPAAAFGNLLLTFIAQDGTTVFDTRPWDALSGWTENIDAAGMLSSRRTVNGFLGSSYTFTLAAGSKSQAGIMLALANAAYDGIGEQGALSTNPFVPSLTMTAPGLVFAFYWSEKAGISFISTPEFSLVAADADGTKPSWALFSKPVDAGATGEVFAVPSSDSARGVLVGVREA